MLASRIGTVVHTVSVLQDRARLDESACAAVVMGASGGGSSKGALATLAVVINSATIAKLVLRP